ALCAIDSRSDVPSSWNELVASRSECAGGSVCSSLDCYSRAFVVLENRSDSPSGSAHAGLADRAAMSWISCISYPRGLGTRCDSARTAHGELDGCARRRGRAAAGSGCCARDSGLAACSCRIRRAYSRRMTRPGSRMSGRSSDQSEHKHSVLQNTLWLPRLPRTLWTRLRKKAVLPALPSFPFKTWFTDTTTAWR